MSTVVIQKYNETHIKILCEKSVAYDLRDRFSFFAPNYKHHPKFKKRLWDGRIYLFSTMTRLIYKGLFNEVVEFLEDVGCKVEKQYQPVVGNLSFDEAKSLYNKLGGKYEPFDHQVEFLQTALNHKNAVLLSATSSGKSFSIYALARILASTGKRGLVVVPTINLVNQLYKDFLDYSHDNGWNVNENVHLVFQGQEKSVDVPITISTWQSIHKLDESYFHRFDFIIGDECHGFKAKSLKHIMESSINAEYRIGCTGTLDGEQVNELTLTGLFGPVHDIIDVTELIDGGMATPLKINTIIMNYPENSKVITMDYSGQTDWFTANEVRNAFIRKLIVNEKGNKLVLFQHVKKHGIPLYNDFKKHYPDKEIYFISGKVNVKEREEIREKLANSNDAILIASYGTYSTGMNVPSLHHIFSLFPGKSPIRINQSIGRAIRLHDGKEQATFWDFGDKLKGYHPVKQRKMVNFGYHHLTQRIEMYIKKKFPIQFYEVNLE